MRKGEQQTKVPPNSGEKLGLASRTFPLSKSFKLLSTGIGSMWPLITTDYQISKILVQYVIMVSQGCLAQLFEEARNDFSLLYCL